MIARDARFLLFSPPPHRITEEIEIIGAGFFFRLFPPRSGAGRAETGRTVEMMEFVFFFYACIGGEIKGV